MQLLKDLTIVVLNKHFVKTITNYVTSYNIHFKYMFTYVGKMSPMITFMMELHGCPHWVHSYQLIPPVFLFPRNTQFSDSSNCPI